MKSYLKRVICSALVFVFLFSISDTAFASVDETDIIQSEMLERETGDIINISSTAGQKGGPVTSAYSASKAAVIGLSESLMMEVRKKNIRVTTLTPSTVATDMAVELNLTDGNPEKVMQPEDMAELMVAQLKLNPRVVLKNAGLWSNNP